MEESSLLISRFFYYCILYTNCLQSNILKCIIQLFPSSFEAQIHKTYCFCPPLIVVNVNDQLVCITMTIFLKSHSDANFACDWRSHGKDTVSMWPPVACKFACDWRPHMQYHFAVWPPVACKLNPGGRYTHAI